MTALGATLTTVPDRPTRRLSQFPEPDLDEMPCGPGCGPVPQRERRARLHDVASDLDHQQANSNATRNRGVPSYLAPISQRITDAYRRPRRPIHRRVCFSPNLTEVEETTPPVTKFGCGRNPAQSLREAQRARWT